LQYYKKPIFTNRKPVIIDTFLQGARWGFLPFASRQTFKDPFLIVPSPLRAWRLSYRFPLWKPRFINLRPVWGLAASGFFRSAFSGKVTTFFSIDNGKISLFFKKCYKMLIINKKKFHTQTKKA
jgi:hypothetical protein